LLSPRRPGQARPGTHNHRVEFDKDSELPACLQNAILWVWVLAFAGTTEVIDLPDGLIFRNRVKYPAQKYFAFTEMQISRMFAASRSSEGRFAIVMKRAAGCDGRGWHQLTSDAASDGEGVWS
jgi:hypothetical protein